MRCHSVRFTNNAQLMIMAVFSYSNVGLVHNVKTAFLHPQSLTKIIPKCNHMDLPIIDLQMGLMDTVWLACYMDSSVSGLSGR